MKLLTYLFLLTFLYACGTTAEEATDPAGKPITTSGSDLSNRQLESPDITFQIAGLNSGQASLIGTFTDQHYKADSAAISPDGTIVFKRTEPYKPGFYYLLLPDRQMIQLLIDQDQTFTMKTNLGNMVNDMQVEGSVDNQLLYEVMLFEETQRPQFNQLSAQLRSTTPGSAEYSQIKMQQENLANERKAYLNKVFTTHSNTLYSKFKKAGQNPEISNMTRPDGTLDTAGYLYKYRAKFWDDVDFSDERLLYTPVIANKLKRYINELTGQNPDSIKASADMLVQKVYDYPEYYKFFANWIVLNYEPTKTSLMDSEAVFVHMIQNYFTYDRAFWSDSVEVHGLQLRAYEMSNSLIGQKGPDITANDPSGTPRSIYEKKAPYVIVYMWNPDCEHCAEETPKLVNFYHQWKNKGVDVYAIAINTEDDKWRQAIKRYNMPWTNVMDPTNKSIYATYFVDNTPEIYVLNPDRIIIGKNLKVDQISTIVERDMRKRGVK